MEEPKMSSLGHAPAWATWVKLSRAFVRIALGALFIFAGAAKAYDPGVFAIEIQRYNLIPWITAALVAEGFAEWTDGRPAKLRLR